MTPVGSGGGGLGANGGAVGGFGVPPSGPGGSAATAGAYSGGVDLTDWEYWWGHNRDPYLNLKAALHTGGVQTGSDEYFIGRGELDFAFDRLRPAAQTIRQTVVPALLQALRTERQNDIVTGTLIALAKIGEDPNDDEARIEEVITPYLADPNQEIAETAAIALGILAADASVPTLTDLLLDRTRGRELVDEREVNYRTRAFAAYGLGLIGHQTHDNALRQRIATALVEVIEQPNTATHDIKVAAVVALGLVPIDRAPATDSAGDAERDTSDPTATRTDQVRYLIDQFNDDRERHPIVRAHAPRSLAQLLPTDAPVLRTEVVEALLRAVRPRTPEQRQVVQSSLLALGQIGDCDADPLDVRIRATLERWITTPGDQQSKRFATMSLARVGGRPGTGPNPDSGYEEIRSSLTRKLARSGGGMSRLKPWLGLALGVMQRARVDHGEAFDREVAQILRTALADCRSPADLGAYCIAVGISQDQEAGSIVTAKLATFSDDAARGYAAVTLGLLGARDKIQPIQDIVRGAKYRPLLLKQAAVALGLLGDKDLVPELVDMLGRANGLSAQASIANGLGYIGDSRSISPLVRMLEDDQLTASARAFAAVALGTVSDKEPLPWASKIATDINYRATTATLTDANGAGILDLL